MDMIIFGISFAKNNCSKSKTYSVLFLIVSKTKNDTLGCNLCFHGHIMFVIICQTVFAFRKPVLQVQNWYLTINNLALNITFYCA